MIVDLTKLIYNQIDKIDIDDIVNIPKEYLDGSDVKDISDVKIEGNIEEEGPSYVVNLNIKCELTLTCAVSLKEIKYPIDIDINEIISENDENIEIFDKIVNNSIDLVPIIWQNILMEVPIRVVSPDVKEENIYGDGWKFIIKEEEDKEIDPRLSKLKDFLSE